MKRDPARANDEWNMDKIEATEAELSKLPSYVVLSGGWAWHFMSPPHKESKLFHDHKDVDVFIPPKLYAGFANIMGDLGYVRIWTKFDKYAKKFYRFEKRVDYKGESVKILIDAFLEEVPAIQVNGKMVVAPRILLNFYGTKHTTDDCTAVKAARKLVVAGQDPVNRKELVTK